MNAWQQVVVLAYGLINLLVSVKGVYESKNNKAAYGLTPYLTPLGIFAWGDAVIFGGFWTLASIITIVLKDWYLFLLIVSVFWLVRSLGETIYWFNQQFSSKTYDWNKPEKLAFHSIFHNDSIWFIYQIIWQCTTVISIIFSIYFAKMWLGSL